MQQQELYQQVSELLVNVFEVPQEQIHPGAHLYQDLDLDSIDAVDMVVHLQNKLHCKLKPETFKTVRTVQDIVDVLAALLASPQP